MSAEVIRFSRSGEPAHGRLSYRYAIEEVIGCWFDVIEHGYLDGRAAYSRKLVGTYETLREAQAERDACQLRAMPPSDDDSGPEAA